MGFLVLGAFSPPSSPPPSRAHPTPTSHHTSVTTYDGTETVSPFCFGEAFSTEHLVGRVVYCVFSRGIESRGTERSENNDSWSTIGSWQTRASSIRNGVVADAARCRRAVLGLSHGPGSDPVDSSGAVQAPGR